MKQVILYTDENGKSDIADYLKVLKLKNDKDSNINSHKINGYIRALSLKGVSIGYPYVKYLGNKLWELRPLRHRILFIELDDKYILLSHFIKETNKTPTKEIVKARKRAYQFLERKNNEK